jgi:hypothetical protein
MGIDSNCRNFLSLPDAAPHQHGIIRDHPPIREYPRPPPSAPGAPRAGGAERRTNMVSSAAIRPIRAYPRSPPSALVTFVLHHRDTEHTERVISNAVASHTGKDTLSRQDCPCLECGSHAAAPTVLTVTGVFQH